MLCGGIVVRYVQESGYDVLGQFEITRCLELVVSEEETEAL